MTVPRSSRTPAWTVGRGVVLTAAVIMAYHVSSRAARDTLFLTVFDVRLLPWMGALASALSIAASLYAGARIARSGPQAVVPRTFALSAVLFLVEWWFVLHRPAVGAVLLFLHVALLGPVIVSGFWSMVGDKLDSRTTRASIGRISALATVGGLVGVLLTERVSAVLGLPAMLPALALSNLWCAWRTARWPGIPSPRAGDRVVVPGRTRPSGWRMIGRVAHLRNLALIVLGASISAAILDYVFKSQVRAHTAQSIDLMRVFLGYNGLVAIGTFVAQLLLTRAVAGHQGPARAIAALPATVVAGGVAAFLSPSPWLLTLLRGGEAVLHGSLFRGGYELLYSGLPKEQRHRARILIDVGCDRLGDVIGFGAVVFTLELLPVQAGSTLLLLAAAVSGVTLLVALRLWSGHLSALEESLRSFAQDDLARQRARYSSLQFAMGATEAHGLELEPAEPGGGSSAGPAADVTAPTSGGEPPTPIPPAEPLGPSASGSSAGVDAVSQIVAIGSEDPDRARHALRSTFLLDAAVVPWAIRLLGVEGLEAAAAEALARVAERHVGQLIDSLLDPTEAIAVRRNIPTVLETCASPRTVEGLSRALFDHRFDVRSRSALGLARVLGQNPELHVDPARVYEAICWEAQLDRQTWAAPHSPGGHGPGGMTRAFLLERAERGREHVFTLLSLVLPREPLQAALNSLKAGETSLHGTVAEYFDGVLPPAARRALRDILESTALRHDPDSRSTG